MTYTEKLSKAIEITGSCLCVGLDPNLDLIPAPLKKDFSDSCELVSRFLIEVIDSTQDHCAAYKPNLGFFEALGPGGLQVFREVLDHVPADKIVIADAKRGDISSTADHYAKAYFEVFDVDAITLNPLMGFETLNPFLKYPEKGLYTLTLTSNPGAADFLTNPYGGYPSMAAFIASRLAGLDKSHATHLGMVVGATKTRQISEVIGHHPNSSLLIPGIGTQGGSITALVNVLQNHKGIPLVNSSRSIIYAGENNENWKGSVADKALELKQALTPLTQRYV